MGSKWEGRGGAKKKKKGKRGTMVKGEACLARVWYERMEEVGERGRR